MTGRYLESIICESGHKVTHVEEGELFEPYCFECGSPTTNKCYKCKKIIKNEVVDAGLINMFPFDEPIPLYCTNCSEAYPWTIRILESSSKALDMDDSLTESDRNKLKEDILNLIENNLEAKASAHRFKETINKAKPITVDIIKGIVIDFLVKASVSIIFP